MMIIIGKHSIQNYIVQESTRNFLEKNSILVSMLSMAYDSSERKFLFFFLMSIENFRFLFENYALNYENQNNNKV